MPLHAHCLCCWACGGGVVRHAAWMAPPFFFFLYFAIFHRCATCRSPPSPPQTKAAVQPTDTLLVVDAMTGQEAAALVKSFADAVDITGAVRSWRCCCRDCFAI